MKKELRIIPVMALMLSYGMWAQTYADDTGVASGSNFDSNQLSLYTSQFLSPAETSNASVSNQVFITQIGSRNAATANITARQSNVGLLQSGNNNETYIDRRAVQLNERVVQFGNNNVFYDLGSTVKLTHDGQVVQTGNNQRLLWAGSNSLSDRLRISMQGNNQTIIIRNIKRQ